MMINKNFRTLLSGIVLISCISAPVFADSTSGNLVNDSVITTKIKAEMMMDKSISSINIGVETNDGVVTLTGTVPTDNEANAIIETAKSTPGVSSVDVSKLIVTKSTQPIADAVITAKVKAIFMKEKVFGSESISVTGINVETKDGVVYLTGHASGAEADNAMNLARSVDGVKRVDSRIK